MPNITPIIRDVIPEDYKLLVSFLNEFDQNSKGENYWRDKIEYWWEKNPSFDDECIRGAIIIFPGECKIVGFIGLIRVRLFSSSGPQFAYSLTTWRVLLEYRMHSLKLIFHLNSRLNKYLLFNYTANEVAYKVFTSLKFFPLKKTNSIKTYIFFLESFYSKKLKRLHLNSLIGITKFFFKKFQLNSNVRYLVKRTDSKDMSILWKKVAKNYSLSFERNAKQLRWVESYNKSSLRILGCYDNESLVSCSVFLKKTSTYNKFVCIDHIGLINKFLFSTLFNYFDNKEEFKNIDFIEFPIFNSSELKNLRFINLYSQKRPDKRLIRFPFDDKIDEASFFTLIEGDLRITP